MPSIPAATPAPSKAAKGTGHAIAGAIDPPAEAAADAASPIELFTSDYDANNGNIASISPPRLLDQNKRLASPRKPSSADIASPARKKVNAASSPRRRIKDAVVAASTIVNELVSGTNPTPASVTAPPSIIRNDPSPTSVLETVFTEGAPKKPKSGGLAMIGLVPKSGFLKWMREKKEVKTTYTKATINKHLRDRRADMMYHFSRKGKTWTNRDAAPDDDANQRVTRSSAAVEEDWVIDMDAANCEVVETRRLDRYPIEHILTLPMNTRLLLLLKMSDDRKVFLDKGRKVHEQQQLPTTFISGSEYYQLQCTISDTSDNELVTGGVRSGYTDEKFERDFNGGHRGFKVKFNGTGEEVHMTWKQLVMKASTFMFFGAPLSMTRSFDDIFNKMTNLDNLHTRFLTFYDEFEGDVTACFALYNAYLSCRMGAMETKLKNAEKKKKNYNGGIFRTKKVQKFLGDFDKVCEEAIESIFVEFKNHSAPIVSTPTMKEFIAQGPEIFGDMWDLFCDLRGLKRKHKSDAKNFDEKERDVFFELLSLARVANRKVLVHWALIQNIANYARGVGRAAEQAFAYFGMGLSNTSRRRLFAKITGEDKKGRASKNTTRDKQCKLFRTCAALVFAYDNYQKGVSLQQQRGKHSSAFFKGTHQVAHKVLPFTDCTFDELYVNFTQHDQDIPSPWGMPAFELIDTKAPGDFFVEYENFVTVVTPDFTGERVRAYIDLRNTAKHMCLLSRAFPAASEDDTYFDQCPKEFDLDKLKKFRDRSNNKEANRVLRMADRFQEHTVSKWNPHVKDCSLTIYLGLVGIDEAASRECGAITLDLLLRAGVLVEGDDGDWSLAEDWDQRRIYLFGDAKTIENITKFVRDMQDRRTVYSVANLQAEVFLQALTVVMDLPGDWHAGLNMAQSIFNVMYTGFLDQFQELLGWKKINKDVSSCYYQATRLITFVHDELVRFFAHQFISQREPEESEGNVSDAEFLTSCGLDFMTYLRSLKESDDKWIASCGVFIELAYDLLEFINAYRIGDAICIEYGYQKHAPVWEATGQNKYVEIFYGQQETLYRDNPFSRLQELRLNRVVRRYFRKRCVAQDEFLEHGNRFFSEFPMPKTLTGFANQSQYVGVGLMSKQFCSIWYCTKLKEEQTPDYDRTAPTNMTPEKKLVYEVFCLLGTHVVNPERTGFELDYVTSISDKISTDLRRERLESSMKDGPATSCDGILETLSGVYQQSIDKEKAVDPDEELEKEDLAQVEDEDAPTTRGNAGKRSTRKEKVQKQTMSEQMGLDLWWVGRCSFAEKDILALREEAHSLREIKSTLRSCILANIGEQAAASKTEIGIDLDYIPSWQRHFRSVPNNLGFKG